MSATNVFWMSVGAVGLGALAFYMNDNRAAATSPAEVKQLIPGLRAQLNDVDYLALTTADESLTFTKEGDAWMIVERGGFPADGGKVGTFLLAIEDSKRLEQKTSKPERYADLGLDPDAEDAPTSRVVVQADGSPAADLWIGNRRGTGAGDAFYVRVEGEPGTWVAGGDLEASSSLADWADTTVLDIDRERIHAVRIEHPDGNVVQATHANGEEDAERMTLIDIPAGQELQSEWVTSRFDSGLAGLTFEDVEAETDADFPADEVVRATYWTDHGLAITLTTLAKEGGGLRAKLSAAYDPSGAPSLMTGPVVDELPQVDLMAGEEGAQETESEEDTPPTPEELQAEAEAINLKAEGWIYSLPEYKSQALRPRMDELVKDIEVPGADEAMDGAGLPNGLNSNLGGFIEGMDQDIDKGTDKGTEEIEKQKDGAMDALQEAAQKAQDGMQGEIMDKAKEGKKAMQGKGDGI